MACRLELQPGQHWPSAEAPRKLSPSQLVTLRDLVALDFQQLHLEDKCRTTGDLATGTAVAVGEIGGDVHLPLVALHHELHGLGPALDDLVGSKGRRIAALVGGVELRAIDQRARVVRFARRILRGVELAAAFCQHLVHEAGGQRDDVGVLRLLGQKRLALLVGGQGAAQQQCNQTQGSKPCSGHGEAFGVGWEGICKATRA
mmetsp:Transcript_16119/g.42593  ORF Transcript_16119/g.42593 Transcript_16119/m.42593 type:complete len:202 (+) Transcript_16119:108-713(+)